MGMGMGVGMGVGMGRGMLGTKKKKKKKKIEAHDVCAAAWSRENMGSNFRAHSKPCCCRMVAGESRCR